MNLRCYDKGAYPFGVPRPTSAHRTTLLTYGVPARGLSANARRNPFAVGEYRCDSLAIPTQRVPAVAAASSGERAPPTSTPAVGVVYSGNRLHLAKVRVAGSSPVVRSNESARHTRFRRFERRPVGGAQARSTTSAPHRSADRLTRRSRRLWRVIGSQQGAKPQIAGRAKADGHGTSLAAERR